MLCTPAFLHLLSATFFRQHCFVSMIYYCPLSASIEAMDVLFSQHPGHNSLVVGQKPASIKSETVFGKYG